ncbi:MAG: carboxypeptidase PM20D1, partial [Candidatus Azotimanducaceae bacterium]
YLKENNVQLAWSLDEGSFVLNGILPGLDTMVAAINVAEKGGVTLDITAYGAGGHSSSHPKTTPWHYSPKHSSSFRKTQSRVVWKV